jgi:hypothetical protein
MSAPRPIHRLPNLSSRYSVTGWTTSCVVHHLVATRFVGGGGGGEHVLRKLKKTVFFKFVKKKMALTMTLVPKK